MKNFIHIVLVGIISILALSYALHVLEKNAEFHVDQDDKNPEAFIANFYANAQELKTMNITESSRFLDRICGILVDTPKNKFYLTSFLGKFHIIDSDTNQQVGQVSTGLGSCAIEYDKKDDMVFVLSEQSNFISVINGTSYEILDMIGINLPYEMVANSNTDLLYVTSDKNDQVFVIDKIGKVQKIFDITDPCGISIDLKENRIYITSEDTSLLYVIDGESNEIISKISVGQGPRGISVDEKNGKIYVANSLSNTISVIDSKLNSVSTTIPVINDPRKVLINPNTNTLYLLGGASNSLAIIDSVNHKVKNFITIQNPWNLAINPTTNTIYVTNLSNQVFIFEDKMENFETDNSIILSLLIVSVVSVGIVTLLVKKTRTRQETRI